MKKQEVQWTPRLQQGVEGDYLLPGAKTARQAEIPERREEARVVDFLREIGVQYLCPQSGGTKAR